MRKCFKRTTVLGLGIIALLYAGIPVYANNHGIMPLSEVCGNCERGQLIYEYQNVEWLAQVGKCSHYDNGIDTIVGTDHQFKVHCTYCEYEQGWHNMHTTYEEECHGYDNE